MASLPAKVHADLIDEFNEEMNDSWLKILDKENKGISKSHDHGHMVYKNSGVKDTLYYNSLYLLYHVVPTLWPHTCKGTPHLHL